MRKYVLIIGLFLAGCYGNELVAPNDGHLNEVESGVAWITDANNNTFKVFLSAPNITDGVMLYLTEDNGLQPAIYVLDGKYTEVLNPVFWNSFDIVNGRVENDKI